MVDGSEQWVKDMNLIVHLFNDWTERENSATRPLSSNERVAYLAIDYLVRMEMHAFDGLIGDETYETVEALKLLGLTRYASALQAALDNTDDWEGLEAALRKISSGFEGRLEFEATVAAYIRARAS